MSKLGSGNQYDIIFQSSDWADRPIKGNQLLRIDKEQLTNLGDRRYGRSARRGTTRRPSSRHTRSTPPA